MRYLVVAALAFSVAGCKASGPAPSDASAPAHDLASGGLDLTGKLASALALQLGVDFGADGGARMQPLTLYTVWTATQTNTSEGASVDGAWGLCDVPLPGLIDVPVKVLGPVVAMSSHGTLSSTMDGAMFTQPDVAVVLGAKLADPVNDPLPGPGAPLCSDAVKTGCLIPDTITMVPGTALLAHGFTPDIDLLYVDLRVKFALTATAKRAGTLDGSVTSASIEAHVLACRLSGGAECTPATVAKLEAAHPKLTVMSGTLRSHVQNFYFTCPELLDDPEGALAGIEPPDGGEAQDLGHAGGAGFSTAIQSDLDARGCATGGCHEKFEAPAHLRLVFQPATMEERRRNYEAVLPWTVGANGGKLLNTAPLPDAMRARWMGWISDGKPF